ncbi:hypothetical protein AAY473_022170 [Plecturocebus cupreus]
MPQLPTHAGSDTDLNFSPQLHRPKLRSLPKTRDIFVSMAWLEDAFHQMRCKRHQVPSAEVGVGESPTLHQ